MKKLIMTLIVLLVMTGCSKNEAVQFCEGVDMDGKGVNCGKKFTPGDLTGVIKQSKPFDTELLEVKVLRVEKSAKTVEKTIHLKVERDKSTASTPLSFYNTGKYVVEIYKDKDKLGESGIEVAEVY
jgi:cytochrome c556